MAQSRLYSHIERMQVCNAIRVLQRGDGLRKQLSCLFVKLEQVVGPYVVKDPAQRWPVGPEQEEFFPEALGFLKLFRLVLLSPPSRPSAVDLNGTIPVALRLLAYGFLNGIVG
jgi:hypothetical protein